MGEVNAAARPITEAEENTMNVWKTAPDTGARQDQHTETALWGTKAGSPDHYEEMLYECKGYTNLSELKTRAEAYAQEQGYDRLRLEVYDMRTAPCPPELTR